MPQINNLERIYFIFLLGGSVTIYCETCLQLKNKFYCEVDMSIYQKVNQTKIVKTLFCIHFPEGCLSLSRRPSYDIILSFFYNT